MSSVVAAQQQRRRRRRRANTIWYAFSVQLENILMDFFFLSHTFCNSVIAFETFMRIFFLCEALTSPTPTASSEFNAVQSEKMRIKKEMKKKMCQHVSALCVENPSSNLFEWMHAMVNQIIPLVPTTVDTMIDATQIWMEKRKRRGRKQKEKKSRCLSAMCALLCTYMWKRVIHRLYKNTMHRTDIYECRVLWKQTYITYLLESIAWRWLWQRWREKKMSVLSVQGISNTGGLIGNPSEVWTRHGKKLCRRDSVPKIHCLELSATRLY